MTRSIIQSSRRQEQPTEPGHTLNDLAERTRELLDTLPAPELRYFLQHWPQSAIAHQAMVERPSAAAGELRLSALDHLPVAAHARGHAADIIAALNGVSSRLSWRQSYSARDVGDEFLRNYAWTEILGPGAPFDSDRMACGFLLLGPHTLYPLHRHEAEEIYVPLSGLARWCQGDVIWREHPPGAVIRHASDEPHAMHTGAEPLLALYLWRSDNLRQKAVLDPPALGNHAP